MTRRLLTLALLFAATTAGAAKLDRTLDRTFDVRPGARVALDNVNGRVTVTAWNQPRVRVVAHQHVESHDSALANKTIANLVSVTADPGGVRIHTNNPKNEDGFFAWLAGMSVQAGVTYDITVPRAMNLDIETVNGTVTASDVSGTLRFSTVNGRIMLERCAGAVDASTTNGGIAAELLQVAPGRPLSLSTTNGRIMVSLPRTIAARVDAGTTNGSITSDLPVQTTAASKHSLRGTLNGGGTAEVRLRTTNGSITIKGR
jgi:DUF4097 and DUF4098 domain-containing protein YvlB